MKRILLLVFLIVSVVQLGLERYRLYLFLSIAFLSLLLRSESARHHRVHTLATERAGQPAESTPLEAHVADSLHADSREDQFERLESTSTTTLGTTSCTATDVMDQERTRLLNWA
jgi:hypothetical protein